MEYNPSGRVQRIGNGALLPPGTCILCGTGYNDDGFIDFGVNIEWFGQLYFCATCALEIGSAVGAYSSVEVKNLLNDLNASLDDYQGLKKRLEDVTGELDTLRSAFRIVSAGDTGDSPDVNSSQGISRSDALSADTDRLIQESTYGRTGEDSEPTESGTGDGPHDDIGSERSDTAGPIGL